MSNNVKTLEDIAKLPPGVTEVEAEGIGDAELVALSSKTSITDLTLWCDENVTDKGIQCLVRLPRLEKLIIHSASLMTDKGLASLGCLTNLKELWLGSLPLISDDVLGRTLQNLKKLSYLDLSYIGHRMHVYMQALEQRQNPDDIVPPPPERTGREYLKALLSLPDLREIKLEENELVD
ncbi:MAG: hypothetical protein L6Q71_08910, partial [Planctomycetes bacterium]|nr:hypothetical protein [Planctomycetota bacterium]